MADHDSISAIQALWESVVREGHRCESVQEYLYELFRALRDGEYVDPNFRDLDRREIGFTMGRNIPYPYRIHISKVIEYCGEGEDGPQKWEREIQAVYSRAREANRTWWERLDDR